MFNTLILKTPDKSKVFLLQNNSLHWDFPKIKYTENDEETNKAIICSHLTDTCGLMISMNSLELKEVTETKRIYMLKDNKTYCGVIKLSRNYSGCGWF